MVGYFESFASKTKATMDDGRLLIDGCLCVYCVCIGMVLLLYGLCAFVDASVPRRPSPDRNLAHVPHLTSFRSFLALTYILLSLFTRSLS